MDVERQTVEDGRSWHTSFAVRLDLGRDLPPRVRAIMLGSARHCEVHKFLTGELQFDYGWVVES